jgi:crotonobetainyl-CoA:carnitine CoA-transferase CaiB-like acyl-CoA transferase
MTPATLLAGEHLRERHFFGEVEQPGIGRLPVVGNIFRMTETPLRFGPAPRLGEHDETLPDDDGAST